MMTGKLVQCIKNRTLAILPTCFNLEWLEPGISMTWIASRGSCSFILDSIFYKNNMNSILSYLS